MIPVAVVGIAADGALADPDLALRADAVVVGAPRHLDLLPEVPGQLRLPLPAPLREGLVAVVEKYAERPVVVLASGDPLVAGVGTTLVELLGPTRVRVVPAVSSVALARAALGWPAESHATVRATGADVSLVHRELAPGRRILVLSADEETPDAVADLLCRAGYGDSIVTVLGDLGTPVETRATWMASERVSPSPRLNVLAIEATGSSAHASWTAGLPDDAFEHDGQLTKRDLRASALARLAPVPGAHLWDVGAGAGSVGIEWMRAHPTCTATAIEADPERALRIARNARRLGVPGLEVVTGRAPDALAGVAGTQAPDAVFVGGGATAPGV
ncbi:MAG: precorrin-6y C5,15-methyltransferase (decarboxylating) subunit CbiE, partial [Nocardioides sp.]|uniref:precorrin-6y C5,15-methyltransferase (decarboxylating) subunit CbiE n=1 Tax=Nocardioides sp. TaxID=35761 RepID=UPI0039E3649C